MKKYWNAKTKKLMTEEEMKKSSKGKKANEADEKADETKEDAVVEKTEES